MSSPPRARRSLSSGISRAHKLRHAQSVASMHSGHAASPRPESDLANAELAMRNLDAMKRLREANSALERQLAEALDATMKAEERAKRAEEEAMEQRERMKAIAIEADEEIASLRKQIVSLESAELAAAQQVGSQGKHNNHRRRKRRASYSERLDEELGTVDVNEIDLAHNGQSDSASPQRGPEVDTEKLLLATRHLVELSKDVVLLTKPIDYGDLES